MKKGDVSVLNQIVLSIEGEAVNLEKFYSAKDYDNFNKSKKIILDLNKKFGEIIK